MVTLREIRNGFLLAHSTDIISNEKFVFLHDRHTSKNLYHPYWSYNEFDLKNCTGGEYRSELRFLKGDV